MDNSRAAATSSAVDGGYIVTPRMLELADSTGYLSGPHGGKELRTLYNSGAEKMDPTRLSPFSLACLIGDVQTVTRMLSDGSAPDLKKTVTPYRLSYPALVIIGAQRVIPDLEFEMNHAGVLQLVLKHGAPTSTPNIVGATPLHLASSIMPMPELLQILSTQERNSTLVTNCVEILLSAGVSLDFVNADGTPLRDVYGGAAVHAVMQRHLRQRAGKAAQPFERKECDHCNKVGHNSLCSRCRTARYCSRECQRAAWKKHRPSCHSFGGSSTYSMRAGNRMPGTHTETISIYDLQRSYLGIPAPAAKSQVKVNKSAERTDYPRQMIIKIQLPMSSDGSSTPPMLVYNKKRDFQTHFTSGSGEAGYNAIAKAIREHGVWGAKAYFAAELVSADEVRVKVEVL
ncbi:hypothetical protein BKA62DRAFT_719449, partial [Auriculariales sp. MPI-PUGE-AT-0066]